MVVIAADVAGVVLELNILVCTVDDDIEDLIETFVMTGKTSLTLPNPHLLLAVTVTLYILLGVNPLIVCEVRVFMASLPTP